MDGHDRRCAGQPMKRKPPGRRGGRGGAGGNNNGNINPFLMPKNHPFSLPATPTSSPRTTPARTRPPPPAGAGGRSFDAVVVIMVVGKLKYSPCPGSDRTKRDRQPLEHVANDRPSHLIGNHVVKLVIQGVEIPLYVCVLILEFIRHVRFKLPEAILLILDHQVCRNLPSL